MNHRPQIAVGAAILGVFQVTDNAAIVHGDHKRTLRIADDPFPNLPAIAALVGVLHVAALINPLDKPVAHPFTYWCLWPSGAVRSSKSSLSMDSTI